MLEHPPKDTTPPHSPTHINLQDHTPPLKLDDSHNNFERGMKDTFAPKAADVGEIQCIIVRKSGGGLGGDWHLQEVEIWHPGKRDLAPW